MAKPYKRESDGRWVLSYKDSMGKRRWVYGRTSKECAQKYREALNARDEGRVPANSTVTVSEHIDLWLNDVVRHSRSAGTYNAYTAVLKLAKAEIGHMKLAALRPPHVQRLYSTLLDRGLAPKTVHLGHSALRQALLTAVTWQSIPRSPIEGVRPPAPRARRTMRPLTYDEVLALLDTTRLDHYHVAWLTLVQTGMRISEACGLLWEDVDTRARRISIQRMLLPTRTKPRTWILEESTKTERSKRTVVISHELADALDAERRRQLRLSLDPAQYPTVFRARDNTCFNRQIAYKELQRACRRAGIEPISPHDLRHTCATILLSRNVHPKKVQELLGHSSIQQTLDTYSHLIPEMHDDIAEVMSSLLSTQNAVGSAVKLSENPAEPEFSSQNEAN